MLTLNNRVEYKFFVAFCSFLILIGTLSCLVGPVGPVYGNEINEDLSCQKAAGERWLSDWKIAIEQGEFYRYAVKLFNTPVECQGKITDTFDGNYFGIMQFYFSSGVELKIETFPPESSITTLRVPNGFPDESDTRSFLEQYLRDIGLRIDWTKPEERTANGEKIIEFYDPKPGFNATAIMVYKNKKLIKIGYSIAL